MAEASVYRFKAKAEYRNEGDIIYPNYDEIKGALITFGNIDTAASVLMDTFNFGDEEDEEYLIIRDVKLRYLGVDDDFACKKCKGGVLYYERSRAKK